MKIRTLTLLLLLNIVLLPDLFSQNVAINSDGSLPDTSAILDVSSTNKGFLLPRMITAQRDAIILPATGLVIFNTATNYIEINTGTPLSPFWLPLTIQGAIDTSSISNFYLKVQSLISATAPVSYSNGVIGITQATTSTDGYLTSGDWNTFNNKGNGTVTNITTGYGLLSTAITTAGTIIADSAALSLTYLRITDTANIRLRPVAGANVTITGTYPDLTFNATGPGTGTVTSLVTSAPITGGTITTTGTIGITQANSTTDGYLSSGDWNAFNSKLSVIDTTNIDDFATKVQSLFSSTAPITYSNGVIGITQATTSTDGYLTSGDWNTFSNKGNGTVTNITTGYGLLSTAITTTGTIVADSAALSLTYLRITDTANIRLRPVAGTNVTITGTYPDLTFNSNGPGTGTVTSLVTSAPITGGTITTTGTIGITQANSTTDGYLSTGDWNAFNSKLSVIDTTNIDDFAVKVQSLFSSTAPITYANGLIGINQATTSANGYISSADWNTFNNKADVTNTWRTTGNNVASTQVIGTTSNFDFPVITNNTERMRVDKNGNVSIGNIAATEILDVTGNIKFSGALMPGGLEGIPGQILTSQGNNIAPIWTAPVNQSVSFNATGDVTGSTTGTTDLSPSLFIGANKVTNTMLAGNINDNNLLSSYLYADGTRQLTGNWNTGSGKIGVGISPTALLHLKAGTTTATTAPLKFASGANLTTTEAGAIEYNGSHLYFTAANSGPRYQLDQQGVSNYTHNISVPITGGTVTLITNQVNIINPAGSLATLTVNLPSSPANNDVVYIKFTQAIATATYANGTAVDGIASPVAGTLLVLIYDSGTAKWY